MKKTALIIATAIIFQLIATASDSEKTLKSESDLLFKHYSVLNKVKGVPTLIEPKDDNYSDWIYTDTSPKGYDIDYVYLINDDGIIYSIIIAFYPKQEIPDKPIPGQKKLWKKKGCFPNKFKGEFLRDSPVFEIHYLDKIKPKFFTFLPALSCNE